MSDTLPFFDAVEVRTIEPIEPPMDFPFVLVAWYAPGKWWKVHKDMFPDADGIKIQSTIADLQRRGWSHIKIVRIS